MLLLLPVCDRHSLPRSTPLFNPAVMRLQEEKQALEKKMDAERALRKAEEDAFRRLRESERKLRADFEEATRRLFETERQQEQQRVAAVKHEQEAAASHAQLSQVRRG